MRVSCQFYQFSQWETMNDCKFIFTNMGIGTDETFVHWNCYKNDLLIHILSADHME